MSSIKQWHYKRQLVKELMRFRKLEEEYSDVGGGNAILNHIGTPLTPQARKVVKAYERFKAVDPKVPPLSISIRKLAE
jgi:hypothetical protein